MTLEKAIYDKRPAGVGFGAGGWLLAAGLGGVAGVQPIANHVRPIRERPTLFRRAGLMCVVELSASINHNVRVSGIVIQLRSHFFPYCVKEWIRIDLCLGDPLA